MVSIIAMAIKYAAINVIMTLLMVRTWHELW